jgi:hypothetical protein
MVNIKAFRTTVYILVLLNLSEKFAQLGETFTVKNMPPPPPKDEEFILADNMGRGTDRKWEEKMR